ncbi:hypothetical protein C8F01DRAFT_1118191 [Mycena amicta]|nr:hypothetical protein C8F01DRAFT_1118191 [Mycena amicta]
MPPCRSCPPDDCAAYVAAYGSDTCYCGHGAAAHTVFPPRGRCVPTGCPRFQGDYSPHSLCTNPLCGRKWLAHMPLGDGGPTGDISLSSDQPPPTTSGQPPASSNTALVPSQMAPAVPWTLPTAQRVPASTSPQCRNQSILHHQSWGPWTGASFPRSGHQPYPTGTKKAGKKMVVFQTEASKPITIKGVLIPLAPTKYEQHAHHEHIELYPKTLSLFGVDNGELAAALNDHNMVFQLQFDSESPPPFLYIAIHNTIHQHLNGQNVKFAHNPHNIPSSLTDLGQYQGWTNTQHFDLYQQMPWVLATLGKSGAEHRKVNVVPTMPTDWTPQLLMGGKAIKLLPGHSAVFICPRYGPLIDWDNHWCLPFKILKRTNTILYTTECFHQLCPTMHDSSESPSPSPRPHTSLFLEDTNASSSGPSLPPSLDSRHLYMSDAPLTMDEEEDQLQAAIALSRQQEIEPATSSMSNAVSGPSQPRTSSLSRPHHLVRPRPESVSPPSRRPTRQRVEIDLTSESPPSGWGTSGWGSPPPFRLPTPEPAPKPKLRPATWASCLNIHCSPIYLRIVMPTIEAGVSSTFARILSFFGGPSVADDSVQFVPQPDRYQLLARESEWTCGGSHGAGVRKTLASSLMEFVFTTRELYWVPVGDSGTYILRLPTSGDKIIGPAQRTLLQAFGFACQLYTTYVGFLPPQLFGVLAYYALGNDDDGEAFLLDDDLLANLCPEQATRIKEWPATLAEYKQIIQTPNVAQPTQLIYLTADIEELTPSQFINVCELEPGRYALAYKKHLRRIFFGMFQPLQSYAQLRAFSEGFNSPVNSPLAAHMVSFGETMGDRGHLLPLLAATRLNHPDELLAKIHWHSTNNPAMQAQEEKFRTAFERYIRIPGIVEHPLFPLTSRNEFETSAIYDAPRARTLMFLRFVCGMTQLPARIGISFMWRIPRQTDPGLDEDGNFVGDWIDTIVGVSAHSCFNLVDVSLSLSATLLREELPNDDRATDFDLFQYLSYRPITAFEEFGGIV